VDQEATPVGEPNKPGVPGGKLLLLIVADHRTTIEHDLYGLTAPPTPQQAARISADKLLIYQALLDSLPQLPDTVQPGIVIDEQYGASVAELAASAGGIVTLGMPVEAGTGQWLDFAYGDAWPVHVGFYGADQVKLLIQDNPRRDAARRAQQAAKAAKVAAWATQADRDLIVELVVPPTDDELATIGGDGARYERQIRPGHVVEVIEHLRAHGVDPAFWEVEGPTDADGAAALVAAVKRDGKPVGCLLQGRDADHETLEKWIAAAAPNPGFTGFGIGRGIWHSALHARLHHLETAGEARRRIASQYLAFVASYVTARYGDPALPDPEFW
jgi:myo-inositol catabolism protein IolC